MTHPLAQVRRYGPDHVIPAHVHDRPVLCVVLGGAYQERTRGRETEHGSGHALFCPALEAHGQTIAPAGALKLLINPPETALDYLSGRVRLAEAPWVRSRDLGPASRRLAAELSHADEFSALAAEGLVLEIAALFGRDAEADEPGLPAWLARARDHIEATAPAPPSLQALAQAVGRHPATLARAFRRAFHMSVGEFSRRARLERASRLLASTGAPLSEIALECGFCDQPHLTRSFRAAYGVTPARWRRRV
jgi:AraC family transcriptional regulator